MATSITAGSVLSRSFRLFGQAPGLFLSIILILYSPVGLMFLPAALVMFFPAESTPWIPEMLRLWSDWVMWMSLFASLLLSLILTPAASAAVAYGVVQKMRREPVTLGECFRKGFRRWVSVVGASILIGLLTMGGFLLCVVPGLIAMTGWFVAIPALVVEESSATDGMQRSWDLTQGHRLSLFGVVFIFIVLQQLTEVPSYVLQNLGAPDMGLGGLVLATATTGLSLIVTSVQAISSAVAYHDLRVQKEGFGLEEIAATFD